MNKLSSIQYLRLVAATSVVYYHIYAQPNFGLFGVDIFFVISGFVITIAIKNKITPKQFAVDRISRIVPTYWILTTALFALICVYPESVKKTTAQTATMLLYLKSLFFIAFYNAGEVKPPLLRVGWTLNYEIYFYATAWFSLILCKENIFKCIFLLIGFSFILSQTLDSLNSFYIDFFGTYYNFEFLIGILISLLYAKGYIYPTSGGICIILAITSYAFMAYIDAMGVIGNRFILFGIPSATLLIALLASETYINSNSKILIIIRTMGDASYATYLSHFFIVEGFKRILCAKFQLFNCWNLLGVLSIVFISLFVGQIIYLLVDRPAHYYCKAYLQRLLKI